MMGPTDPRRPIGMITDAESQREQGRVFSLAVIARLGVIALLIGLAGSLDDLSRDSYWYHVKAVQKADEYRSGDIQWSLWIDSAWPEFIGFVYYFCGPYLIIILLINAILAALGAVLTFRIAYAVFRDAAVAKLTALVYAIFPSVVYYTSLPLKEAAAGFAMLSIVWGVVSIICHSRYRAWPWIFVGLTIMAGLRIYLVPILIGCAAISLLPMRLKGGTRGMFQVVIVAGGLVVVAYFGAKYYGFEFSDYEATQYYDLEKVNEVRVNLSRGNTSLYERRSDAAFDSSLVDNAWRVAKGLFFFLFTIDITQIDRVRQMAALPEMLFFLYCLPYLYRGVVTSWKIMPERALPVIVFGLAIIVVYGSATTNAGTMYRWRLQALPFLLMIIVYGAAVRQRGILYNMLRRFYVYVAPRPAVGNRRVIGGNS